MSSTPGTLYYSCSEHVQMNMTIIKEGFALRYVAMTKLICTMLAYHLKYWHMWAVGKIKIFALKNYANIPKNMDYG